MLGKNLIQAAAGNAAGEVLGVEDVFSTWLYTGTGSTQTITNGIDLAGEGGLVWAKARSSASYSHNLYDTARGAQYLLESNSANAQELRTTDGVNSFSSSGFTIASGNRINEPGTTFASWTFRKAPGFFDVVTYTGNGSNRTIAHSLGSVPGCIIVKRTDSSANWQVYHRSLISAAYYLELNNTNAQSGGGPWNDTAPTSTVFSLGTDSNVNASGGTYVAYLFAHDEQIFGESGDQSVIKCGNCTAGTEENLGWEPQWVLVKKATATGDWRIYDNMRMQNLADYVNKNRLMANASFAESADGQMQFTATGFKYEADSIYIAIRRGPMKTPTDATTVYENVAYTGDQVANRQIGSTVLADAVLLSDRDATSTSWGIYYAHYFFDRLRSFKTLSTAFTSAEVGGWGGFFSFARNIGWDTSSTTNNVYLNKTGTKYVSHNFRRAPGFFDVVAYTGTGSASTVAHNLGVAPELMIIKRRDAIAPWPVYSEAVYQSLNRTLRLNITDGADYSFTGRFTAPPSASSIFLGTDNETNAGGGTYIAYLFATVPGVSKVGSYTGTGTTLDVDCGFTSGARFVLIKAANAGSTGVGDWYVWDSARGIIAANDPYLSLNSTSAENTSTDYIDPLSSGFQISSTAPAEINGSGRSFIFLAIA